MRGAKVDDDARELPSSPPGFGETQQHRNADEAEQEVFDPPELKVRGSRWQIPGPTAEPELGRGGERKYRHQTVCPCSTSTIRHAASQHSMAEQEDEDGKDAQSGDRTHSIDSDA